MIVSRTPFRISFFGGGSDFREYFDLGYPGIVLGTTIDKYSYVMCRRLPAFFEHKHKFSYSKIETVKSTSEIQNPIIRHTMNWLNIKFGVEMSHVADLPARSGIGSSSVFLIGLINALRKLDGYDSDISYLADTANIIERKMAGEHGGYQDPILAALGGISFVVITKGGDFTLHRIGLSEDFRCEFERHLLLLYLGTQRTSSDVSQTYSFKVDLCKSLADMAWAGKNALDTQNIPLFGTLLDENWKLKKRFSERVSSSHIDDLYATARRAGAYGGKIIGAGSGGMMLLVAPPETHETIIETLDMMPVPFALEHEGARIIYGDERTQPPSACHGA